MSVAANSLITLAQFKAYAAISTTDAARDAAIEAIIDAVSSFFCSFLGREIALTTYTNEYMDGNGEPDLLLPYYPVKTISSITEDDAALTEGLTADYLLYAKEGRLHRMGGNWLNLPKAIKLTYSAGYIVQGATPSTGETALPLDLKLACMMQVGAEWKRAQRSEWGLSGISVEGGSISMLSQDSLLPQVLAILRGYKGILAE